MELMAISRERSDPDCLSKVREMVQGCWKNRSIKIRPQVCGLLNAGVFNSTCSTVHFITDVEVRLWICRAFQTHTGSWDSPFSFHIKAPTQEICAALFKHWTKLNFFSVTAKSRGIISTAQIASWQQHHVTGPKATSKPPTQLPLFCPAKNEALALGEFVLIVIWLLRSHPKRGQEEEWNVRSNEEQRFSPLCTSSAFLETTE